jgi:hypothetical protein
VCTPTPKAALDTASQTGKSSVASIHGPLPMRNAHRNSRGPSLTQFFGVSVCLLCVCGCARAVVWRRRAGRVPKVLLGSTAAGREAGGGGQQANAWLTGDNSVWRRPCTVPAGPPGPTVQICAGSVWCAGLQRPALPPMWPNWPIGAAFGERSLQRARGPATGPRAAAHQTRLLETVVQRAERGGAGPAALQPLRSSVCH